MFNITTPIVKDDRYVCETYDKNNILMNRRYYLDSKCTIKDRENGPAHEEFYDDGSIKLRIWFKNGNYHRDGDLPAYESYFYGGALGEQQWYVSGQSHRINGPASINGRKDGTTSSILYYQHNKFHRTDGPAVIYFADDGITVDSEDYYVNDKFFTKTKFLKQYLPIEYEKHLRSKVYYIAGKKYKISHMRPGSITLNEVDK